MVNLNNIVQGLSRSGAVSGFAGGIAGTAMVGALSGKKGRKMAKSALKIGGLAAIGGLAWSAYQRYQQDSEMTQSGSAGRARSADQTPTIGQVPPSHTVPNVPANNTQRHVTPIQSPRARNTPATGDDVQWEGIGRQQFAAVVDDPTDAGSGSLLLVRAMIAAAAADGHMDRKERQRIFEETQRLELAANEKAMLFDELRQPLDLPELVAQVSNAETAVEVYAASLIAIDQTRPQGQAYLHSLAEALGLPAALVSSLHGEAETVRQSQAA
jgi:uncharacterized membrane protein YebE (DUF533 family)